MRVHETRHRREKNFLTARRCISKTLDLRDYLDLEHPMARNKKARIIILEGSWWNDHEAPQILPYFQALAVTHDDIEICHRTFRNIDDIAYYASRIKKDEGVMLYFACHGFEGSLQPTSDTSISPAQIAQALGTARPGAIAFVHFGSCEMVTHGRRRESHLEIMQACGATWVSGYTKPVDWLPSTFLDLMLVASIFAPQHGETDGRAKRINHNANSFHELYEQTIRQLGFSALSVGSAGERLYPAALR